jgi:uncharacterized coiled-coil DUF342 family protein
MIDAFELIEKYRKRIEAAEENIAMFRGRIAELEKEAFENAKKTPPLSEYMKPGEDEQDSTGTSKGKTKKGSP